MKFDWTIYPGSRISRIRPKPLQYGFLAVRNVCALVRHFRRRFDERDVMIRGAYVDAVKFALAYVDNAEVDGAVGEFGCHGYLSDIIARWLATYAPARTYHVFDSFAGYPAIASDVDKASPHISSGTWYSGASRSPVPPPKLAAALSKIHVLTTMHVGFFEMTLPAARLEGGFALLILDCNLYASHRDVLFHVFARGLVNEGAMVMFADFNVNRASPEFSSRRAWRESVAKFNVRFSDEGPYNWGGRKFIVHGYDSKGEGADD